MWISLTTTLLSRKSLHSKQIQTSPGLQIFNFIWEMSLVHVIISKTAFLKWTSEHLTFQKLLRTQYLSGGNSSPYLLHLYCLETPDHCHWKNSKKPFMFFIRRWSGREQAPQWSGDGTELAEVREASRQCSDIRFYFWVVCVDPGLDDPYKSLPAQMFYDSMSMKEIAAGRTESQSLTVRSDAVCW